MAPATLRAQSADQAHTADSLLATNSTLHYATCIRGFALGKQRIRIERLQILQLEVLSKAKMNYF